MKIKKGERENKWLDNICKYSVSAAAKILRAVLVRQVGGLGRRKYNDS